ncbi:MAG TPA: tetratricopeptide repeat protein [Bryobacteraceae bacterium]|jgi:predicted CXXCH cytochrome family protein|nr:tetratricopeptide repeat protein [Bryobacteraceae bacterium]
MVRLGVLLVWLSTMTAASAAGVASFAGASTCGKCHAAVTHTWAASHHSKMVQPATVAGVVGDFARGAVTLRGSVYRFRRLNGAFFITESYLTGEPQEHRVQYTLGNRRIQHYLTTLADGRIVVLPPTWDIVRKNWFHNLDIDDPEEAPGTQVQIWNKNCYSCHVSQEKKNFDPQKNSYQTSWLDFGINCERCHGPGAEHAAFYAKPGHQGKPQHDVIVQTKLDAARNTAVCAQCHSFRDILVDGFAAGDDYYDHFLPILEFTQASGGDPAYWPDGRPRRFSTDAFGFWQSECYLKGKATCLDCHVVPHNTDIDKNPQLKPEVNTLCTRCHQAEGASLTSHTHHAANSTGSSCVECHMPRTVFSIKAKIRDHAMTVPVPENTLNHGIPNACNVCHTDRDANWALEKMNGWWGPASRQKLIRRAGAFSDARQGNTAAVASLLAILQQPSEGALVRANAAGYLGRFQSDPAVTHALLAALADSEPLVRAIAARAINPGPESRAEVGPALGALLRDPTATVRLSAAVGLIGMGLREPPSEYVEPLELAKQLFRARAALDADDAEQDLAAGRFYLLLADPASAVKAFQTSLKLDPQVPVQYLLGGAYAEQGNFAAAKAILQAIPMSDDQYEKAQRLLKAIAAREGAHE